MEKIYGYLCDKKWLREKNSLEDFININASGKIAMKLEENDKIIGVKICKEDQDILLGTQTGKCIRFMSKKLRLFKEEDLQKV